MPKSSSPGKMNALALQDALERDRVLALLWLRAKDNPYMQAVVPCELSDLHNGDIPIFMTEADSNDLRSSSGVRMENLISMSGLESARARISSFNEESMERQLWIIDASVATISGPVGPPPDVGYQRFSQNGDVSVERLLQASSKVGDRLATLAYRENDQASWLSLHRHEVNDWRVAPAGTDLYDGAPGIVLFLAYLGEVTGEARYTELAKMGWRSIATSLTNDLSGVVGVGAFEGAGGLLYVLAHLSRLWGDPSLPALAERIVDDFSHRIEHNSGLDIVTGAAGGLASLLAWHAVSASSDALDAAESCGQRLVDSAKPMNTGCGWTVVEGGRDALGGFSHGVAGIVWALTELGVATGDDHFLSVVQEGLTYERSLYSEHDRNWRDLRRYGLQSDDSDSGSNSFSISWCHGAPGVALSRLLMWPHYKDNSFESEIAVAVATTIARGFGYNHCLCHGDFGNIEVVHRAAMIFDECSWKKGVARYGAAILADIDENGWRCGVDFRCDLPGLMMGLSGIGMGLLRLAAADRVPSVLALEPPKMIIVGS